MSEVLRYQNRLAENGKAAEDFRLRLAELRRSLWAVLDMLNPVENLDAGRLMELAADFGMLQAELKALLQENAAIKKVLGR